MMFYISLRIIHSTQVFSDGVKFYLCLRYWMVLSCHTYFDEGYLMTSYALQA